MRNDDLRQQIRDFLGFHVPTDAVSFEEHGRVPENGYTRMRISFAGAEGDRIPAFLLLPDSSQPRPFPAILVHHQHNGERHLGKSEVCGLAGDPLQAFGPALAARGFAVLTPDSICFEDRRPHRSGIEPDERDTMQHFNELCYRLVRGDTLMRKVLDDSARAVSLLQQHPLIDAGRIGMLGHSYGGSTTLYHAPLDGRIHFACASGAACSFQVRLAHATGIEMSQVIPGFAARFDMQDLVACMAPRHLLLVSADADKYSMDADAIAQHGRQAYAVLNAADRLAHVRYPGGHPLTRERFDAIVQWLVDRATAGA